MKLNKKIILCGKISFSLRIDKNLDRNVTRTKRIQQILLYKKTINSY